MRERFRKDLTAAMKSKEALKVSTIRMIMAEIQVKDKEKGILIDDERILEVLQGMIRKRKDAASQFEKGGRPELARKEMEEIEIIKEYLPEQMGPEEIRKEAKRAIEEVSAKGPKDMGKVMVILTKTLRGKAEGGKISQIVREELEKLLM